MMETMEATDRDFSILEHVIRDYIHTAEPVSSARIARNIRYKASPATVRNIMMRLDDEGYLEQPHTSAGRVPTDKAYRYFVDTILAEESRMRQKEERLPESVPALHRFVHELAEETGLFTMMSLDKNSVLWAGMDELFDEPEFREYDVARAFASFVEEAHDRMKYFYQYESSAPQVFIGKENPFPDGSHFSSVVGRPTRSSIIISIGPKRMDYERATDVIRRFLQSI